MLLNNGQSFHSAELATLLIAITSNSSKITTMVFRTNTEFRYRYCARNKTMAVGLGCPTAH